MGEPSGSVPIEIDPPVDSQPSEAPLKTSMGPPLPPSGKDENLLNSTNLKKKKGRKSNADKNLAAMAALTQSANKRGRSEVEQESYNESDYEPKDDEREGNSGEIKSLIAQVAKLVKTIAAQSQTVSKLNEIVLTLTKRISSVESELHLKIKTMERKLELLSSNVEEKFSHKSTLEGSSSSQPTWATVVSAKRTKTKENSKNAVESVQFTVPPHQIDQTNFVLAEKEDRERKKNNLIVFGHKVESGKDDRESIEQLFTSIGVDKNIIDHVRRFRPSKKDAMNIEPVFVRIKDGEDRMRVVAAAKKLRKLEGNRGVFICPDRTLCERRLDKQLREERDALNQTSAGSEEGRQYRFVIRDGEVRKVKRYADQAVSKR